MTGLVFFAASIVLLFVSYLFAAVAGRAHAASDMGTAKWGLVLSAITGFAAVALAFAAGGLL